jgi:alpha-1,2-mannosyltransferase
MPIALNSRQTQRWFTLALLLVFAIVSVQYSIKVLTPRRDGQTASAVLRWASQIQMMEEGEDVHKTHNYPNPPIMAMILWPFSELAQVSPLAAALGWFYLKVGMALLAMLWVFRLVQTPERPFPVWAKALIAVLSLRPILGDLTHGNVNIFILFLVVASLYAFSRGKDFLSGVLLALAIACKVTPALFVFYFAWKRAWRVLAGCGAGLVLFFLMVPALWLGWQQNLQALTSWFQAMIVPYVLGGVVTSEHNNQSLPGLIARLLTDAPSFASYIGSDYVPLRYQNIADIGPAGAKWLVKGCMGLFALLVICTCRAPIRAASKPDAAVRRGWPLAAEYGLIVLGMLLFSERTWKHHCVTLLLPFAVLCYGVAVVPLGSLRRRILISGLALATLLIGSTSSGVLNDNPPKIHEIIEQTSALTGPAPVLGATSTGMLTDSVSKQAQVYGAYVWAFGLLGVGIAAMLQYYSRLAAAAGKPGGEGMPSVGNRRAA